MFVLLIHIINTELYFEVIQYLIFKRIKDYSNQSVSFRTSGIYFAEIKPVSLRFNLFTLYTSGYKL